MSVENAPFCGSRCSSSDMPLTVIIPIFKSEELIAPLFDSLIRCKLELQECGAKVVLINDSPDAAPLLEALETEYPRLQAEIDCTLITNLQNLGFLRSANLGMQIAEARRSDVLLLNSDAFLYPGAIRELRFVAASDPMIGFVNPRSNNATIATLPGQLPEGHSPDWYADQALHLSKLLPRQHFVPTAVGFCLLIKWKILAEFGLFDEVYGFGYNEENDYIMRAGRCGYSAALANRAFVYHKGEVSFKLASKTRKERDKHNASILTARYPEYLPSIARYLDSAQYFSQELTAAIVQPKLDLAFDLSCLEPVHNGTSYLMRNLVLHFAEAYGTKYNVYLIADTKTLEFHELPQDLGVDILPISTKAKFAVIVRIGQPSSQEQLARIACWAPINIFFMLDTIALDCVQLSSPNVQKAWTHVCSFADGIVYNSAFTSQQFARRFEIRPDVVERVSYHSLDPNEYKEGEVGDASAKHILIVGNSYPHKYVTPTAVAVANALPHEKVVAIGGSEASPAGNLQFIESGKISPYEMEALYSSAKLLVYPSHVEGFGFPVMKALAHNKPIIGRDIPTTREIMTAYPTKNIYLYETTGQLCEHLLKGLPVWQNEKLVGGNGWFRAANDLDETIQECIQRFNFQHLLRRQETVYALRNLPKWPKAKKRTGRRLAPANLWRPAERLLTKLGWFRSS
jgi:GT2 family glycosyltransferase/glycosyltransferase involved in cell wall biosynthesis